MTDREWKELRAILEKDEDRGAAEGPGPTARKARLLRALALHERVGNAPFDAEAVLAGVVDAARGHASGAFLGTQADADPGYALLELFAIVYASLAFHVQRTSERSLVDLLRLAGVARRGAWPSAIVLRATGLGVGEEVGPDTAYFPAKLLRPRAGAKGVVAEGLEPALENAFRPGWTVVGWECPREGEAPGPAGVWAWPVTIPSTFLAGEIGEIRAYAPEADPATLDALLAPADWSFRPDGATTGPRSWPLQVRPWLPDWDQSAGAAGGMAGRAPLGWLTFPPQPDAGDPLSPGRWLTFRRVGPAAVGLPASGVEGMLIRRPLGGGPANGGRPVLLSNCAAWVNATPDGGRPGWFDRMGLWELDALTTAAERLNGAVPEDWSHLGGPAPTGRISLESRGVAAGGRPAESIEEFLSRAPVALRHRGSPTSADDWERFAEDLDPGGRIAEAAARGTLMPRGSSVASGVQILIRAVGRVGPSARLAAWLRDEWVMRAATLVRPLGTEVEVFTPRPIAVIASGAAPEVLDRAVAALALDTVARDERPPLWSYLMDEFRRRGPARPSDLGRILSGFLSRYGPALGLANVGIEFVVGGGPAPAGPLSSAVPVVARDGRAPR